MWIQDKFNENLENGQKWLNFYKLEAESQISKNLGKFQVVQEITKSRVLGLIWLYAIFLSLPLTLFATFVTWFFNWRRGTLTDKSFEPLIAENDRKTVLLTGSSSSRGKR